MTTAGFIHSAPAQQKAKDLETKPALSNPIRPDTYISVSQISS